MAGTLRQKVLTLYLHTSALDSRVLGWSVYDGTGKESFTTGDNDEPPYETGLTPERRAALYSAPALSRTAKSTVLRL